MKLNPLVTMTEREDEVIAAFGEAELVRRATGRYELRGGTPDDHAAALEWCSLFHHEAVFSVRLESGPRGSMQHRGRLAP